MTRDRMGMGRASVPPKIRGNRLFVVLSALGATILLSLGCQKTDDLLPPTVIDETVLHAVYRSDAEFRSNPIEMDGQAIEREWGGITVPFFNVRISSENGAGEYRPPGYVSIKAVYTNRDLFLLLRWADSNVNALKDAMMYTGDPIPSGVGECVPELVNEGNWERNPPLNVQSQYLSTDDIALFGLGDEDRIALAFEVDSAGNSVSSFRDGGCQIACHASESPGFGRLGYGRLDIWQWLASRTNPGRDLFDETDNPDNALYGIPGFLDDLYADAFAGLSPDPGSPSFRPNFRPGSSIPIYIYRPSDDPFFQPADPERCFSRFGESCRPNNGVDQTYIWREQIEIPVEPFGPCDTLLTTPLPIGREPHNCRPGDIVSGWILTYPSESRADVRGRALYEDGVWTLELGRRLNTTDPLHDVIFSPTSGREYVFTLAVMDNSDREQRGSAPQIMVFDPPVEER